MLQTILNLVLTEAEGFLSLGLTSWKRLLIVFVLSSAVFGAVGLFIPFVSARSFGMGAGAVVTGLLWFLAYLGMRK